MVVSGWWAKRGWRQGKERRKSVLGRTKRKGWGAGGKTEQGLFAAWTQELKTENLGSREMLVPWEEIRGWEGNVWRIGDRNWEVSLQSRESIHEDVH